MWVVVKYKYCELKKKGQCLKDCISSIGSFARGICFWTIIQDSSLQMQSPAVWEEFAEIKTSYLVASHKSFIVLPIFWYLWQSFLSLF